VVHQDKDGIEIDRQPNRQLSPSLIPVVAKTEHVVIRVQIRVHACLFMFMHAIAAVTPSRTRQLVFRHPPARPGRMPSSFEVTRAMFRNQSRLGKAERLCHNNLQLQPTCHRSRSLGLSRLAWSELATRSSQLRNLATVFQSVDTNSSGRNCCSLLGTAT